MKSPWKRHRPDDVNTPEINTDDMNSDDEQTLAADSNVVDAIREQARALRAKAAEADANRPASKPKLSDLAETGPPLVDLTEPRPAPAAASPAANRAAKKPAMKSPARSRKQNPPAPEEHVSLIDTQPAPQVATAWDPSGLTSLSPEPHAAASAVAPSSVEQRDSRNRWRNRLLVLAALFVVVAVAFVLAWLLVTRGSA